MKLVAVIIPSLTSIPVEYPNNLKAISASGAIIFCLGRYERMVLTVLTIGEDLGRVIPRVPKLLLFFITLLRPATLRTGLRRMIRDILTIIENKEKSK